MNRSFRLLILSAGLLASIGTAASAAAALPSTDVVTKVVRFRHVDIATARGAEALYRRIHSAAWRVCRDAHSNEAHECRVRAVDAAVGDVGSALLTSIHRFASDEAEGVVRR